MLNFPLCFTAKKAIGIAMIKVKIEAKAETYRELNIVPRLKLKLKTSPINKPLNNQKSNPPTGIITPMKGTIQIPKNTNQRLKFKLSILINLFEEEEEW